VRADAAPSAPAGALSRKCSVTEYWLDTVVALPALTYTVGTTWGLGVGGGGWGGE
jgi:hypothetical protein